MSNTMRIKTISIFFAVSKFLKFLSSDHLIDI